MTLLQAIILSIVEGLTEYLPISSTGHMIITSWIMGINENDFVKNFEVIVQFGAILSVLVLYWRRFMVSFSFYKKLFVAFLPAAVIGLLVKKQVDILLGDVHVVAWATLVGGVILVFIDRIFAKQQARLEGLQDSSNEIESMTYVQAGLIGVSQCLAFIPGASRSASTILGGLTLKLSRKAAAEFSFFLAVPTLTAATGYKLLKVMHTIEPGQLPTLAISTVIAFFVALLTIKVFIGYLAKHGFFVFGVYRIILGTVILLLLASGHSIQMM